MDGWNCALELDSAREIVAGSEASLVEAIRRGADLRIYTAFRYNEHIEPGSDNGEIVEEVSDFRVTANGNTAHLSTLIWYLIVSRMVSPVFLERIGQLLIFRLTPRGLRRPRLETTRSSSISSRTAS